MRKKSKNCDKHEKNNLKDGHDPGNPSNGYYSDGEVNIKKLKAFLFRIFFKEYNSKGIFFG